MTRSRVRVLALTPIPIEGAGCRFRIAQYVSYLEKRGFDVTISPFYSPTYFAFVYQRGRWFKKSTHALPLLWKRLQTLGNRTL